MYVIT